MALIRDLLGPAARTGRSGRSRTLRAAAGALVCLAVLAGSTGPAVAERDTAVDPRGDVYGGEGEGPTGSGDARVADLLGLRSVHARRVGLRIRTAPMPRVFFGTWVMRVETPEDTFRVRAEVEQITQEEADAYDASPLTTDVLLRGGDGAVRCRDLRMRWRAAEQTLTVRIPRSCLGRPRWIRTGAQSMAPSSDGAPYADDARTSGAPPPRRPTLGPRLYRR